MKTKSIFLLLLIIGMFTNCQKEEMGIEGVWNLVRLNGGLNEPNCDYEKGRIVWTITDTTIKIADNFDTNENFCLRFVEGEYTYSTIEVNGKMFLQLFGQEFGGITLIDDQLFIDQNVTTGGTFTGGVLMRFEK